MPISTLPTPAPSRSQTQAEFDTAYAAHIAALPTFVTEVNALAGELSATSGAGAIAIPYTFSTTTTDADPGAGILRLSAATQNTATVIRADLLGSDGKTYTSSLDIFDDSTNTVKGYIRLVHATDATKFLIFSVTSLASPTGYKNITVTNISSSAASPFANSDAIVLYFTRTGDVSAAPINFARVTVASAATTADIWTPLGNQIDWTGTTTCTGFPAASQAGLERVLICAGAAPFTAGANMLIDGVASGATVTCAANDIVIVRAVTTTQFRLSRVKYDGKPQVGLGVAPTVQIFTSSGTYTKPAGLVAAIVEVCGGGGGGGGVASLSGLGASGGGGGASTMRRLLASAIGATETVTIGAAGAGGDATGGDGGAGGTSSFGSLVDAPGGGGGGGAPGSGFDLGGIGGVTGTNGDVFFEGGDGAGNVFVSSTLGIAGGGGPSRFGGGGRGRNSNSAGVGDAGGQFGGGGGGSYSTGSAHVGGAGFKGVVIVTEYY